VSGSDVSNYATGSPIKDATLLGSTKILHNKLYTPTSGNLDGLAINRVIDTINSGNWISICTWFNCSEIGGTDLFLSMLQTANATRSSSSRFYLRFNPSGFLEIGMDGTISTTTFKPTVGVWYHTAIVIKHWKYVYRQFVFSKYRRGSVPKFH
jgi:hypothetical protein